MRWAKWRYSLRCKFKENFSEAAARITRVLLHLSLLLLLCISFPSPILCNTISVQALSEWVWWWRSLPQCIVGNVRVSLHCCKYGVLQRASRAFSERIWGWKSISSTISLCSLYTSHDLGLLHIPGGWVDFFFFFFWWSCARRRRVQAYKDAGLVLTTRPWSWCRLVLPSAGWRETLTQQWSWCPGWSDIITSRKDMWCLATYSTVHFLTRFVLLTVLWGLLENICSRHRMKAGNAHQTGL